MLFFIIGDIWTGITVKLIGGALRLAWYLTRTAFYPALFLILSAGLTRITFTDAPVTIISSGLDLANPDNFRILNCPSPAVVVADVKKAGALPALHGPVTFVLVPTAGEQQQLGQAQKNYIKAIWTALLKAAGATSVTFIDATGTTASSAAPSAPTVPLPALPGTPIPQVPAGNNKVTCTVPDSYFKFGKHWEPALTPREAITLGIPRSEYEQAALFARTAVEEEG